MLTPSIVKMECVFVSREPVPQECETSGTIRTELRLGGQADCHFFFVAIRLRSLWSPWPDLTDRLAVVHRSAL